MCRALREELGSLDRVERWLKVLVLVRSAPGFVEQPAVANGFTNAIAQLWGEERGVCARSAIGVAELPSGLAVEVEALVALVG
jgi:enamine deaminase RidA (YjgF/YER057c/UK114 family)